LFDLRGERVANTGQRRETIFSDESIEIGDSLNRARACVISLRLEAILATLQVH